MKQKLLFLVSICFFYLPAVKADTTEGACQVYMAIQDNVKITQIQNLTQPLKYPQTLEIFRTYLWKFANGNFVYIEFDDHDNFSGRFKLNTQSQDRSTNEIELNNALLGNRVTLEQVINLVGDGEIVQYDFTNTLSNGPTITGYANSSGNIQSVAINANCGANISNKKVFQYAGSPSNSIYQSNETNTVTNNNTTNVQNYYPVVLPYYFGASPNYFSNQQLNIINSTPNTGVTQPNTQQRIYYKTGPNIFPTTRPSPPYNVPK